MGQVLCPVGVGRDAELAVLRTGLTDALAGRGGCVALVGPAGIGKSRLAREVAAEAGKRGAVVAVGRATPSGTAGAYRPLTEALSQALRGTRVLDDPELKPWLPVLGGIIAPAGTGSPVAESTAAVRGESIVRLLPRLAGRAGW